jgi:hypothetical protein
MFVFCGLRCGRFCYLGPPPHFRTGLLSNRKQRLIRRSAGRSIKENRQRDDMQIAGNFPGFSQLPAEASCLPVEPIFDVPHQFPDIDNRMPRKNLRQSVSQVAGKAFPRPAVQIETEFKCIFV